MGTIYKWYEEKPNLYQAEVSTLEHGLEGIFEIVKLFDPKENSNHVAALGMISLESGEKFPIQVVFPAKYPSAPPKIIVGNFLKDENNNVRAFSPFLLGKGNQYSDGSMCLFSKDMWNESFHNVGWCIKRAQKWLTSATSPEGFQADEIVEEIPSPVPSVGQVLIPKDIILPDNLDIGQFYLSQFKPNHYILEQNVVATAAFSVNSKVEIFTWIKAKTGVTVKYLLENNNMLSLVKNYTGDRIIKNLAFYLPDESNHWHFFKLTPTLTPNNLEITYYLSRIIDNELYLRTKDIFDDKILKTKRVTIVGLGALGSEVARSLARNGVGHFNLFDYDTFEIGNSIRHAADLFYIGESKVEVVKQIILRSNPNITVNGLNIDVMEDDHFVEESLDRSDLCIVLTAEESVDYFFNDYYASKYRIPFIFGRVSSGGKSGSIQIVEYGKSACLRCLSKNNADRLPEPVKEVEYKELPMEYGSCSTPALPGSEIDTKEIALQISRAALQLLLRETTSRYPAIPGSQFYWHGAAGSKTGEPFTWEIKNLAKDENCDYCN